MLPTDLTFTLAKSSTRRMSIDSKFKQYSSKESFYANIADFDYLAYGSNAAATPTLASSVLTFTGVGSLSGKLIKLRSRPEAPFGYCRISVKSLTNPGGNNIAEVGLVADANNKIMARYDRLTRQWSFERSVAGVSAALTTLGEADTSPLSADFDLIFVLKENQLHLYTQFTTNNGQIKLGVPLRRLTYSYVASDLTNPAILSTYCWGIGYITTSAGDGLSLYGFDCGYYGNTGIYGGVLCSWSDGTPYKLPDNKIVQLFINTAPSAAGGIDAVRPQSQGIYTFDPSTGIIEEIGKIFFKENGKMVGHNNLKLIWEPSKGQWRGFVAGWGTVTANGPVDLWEFTSQDDLLHGIHIVDLGTAITFPTATSTYDPDYVVINGQEYLTCSTTSTRNMASSSWNFYITLFRRNSPSDPWTLIWQDTTNVNREGSRFWKVDGIYYVVAAGTGNAYVYTLAGAVIGTISMPIPTGGLPPHATLIPEPNNGKTKYFVSTFDNSAYDGISWSVGTVFCWEATQQNTKLEFESWKPKGILSTGSILKA